MEILHRVVAIGLVGMVVTGVMFMLPVWEYMLTRPVLYLKMAFVTTLFYSARLIAKIAYLAYETSFAELPDETRTFMKTSGAVSSISWMSATLIGLFFLWVFFEVLHR